MDDRPITNQKWSEYSILGDVDSNAIGLCYGCFLNGRGKVWVDDMRIFVRKNNSEDWRPIALTNTSFEEFSSTTTGTTFKGWFSSPHYSFTPTKDNSYFGANSVLIEDKGQPERGFRGELFATKPSAGETLLKNLAGGLRCALPVALYTDSVSTLGTTPKSAQDLAWMLNTLEGYDAKLMTMEQEPARLATVIMVWNVLQHSYPYFDVVRMNWDSVLTITLAEALVKPSAPEFRIVMRKMLEHLRDGHADYYQGTSNLLLPISAENIEGQLIVLASQDSLLKRGDIIVNIDGKDTRTLLAQEEALISGSPQWKRAKAVLGLVYTPDKSVQLTVNRNGQILTIETERKWYRKIFEYPSTKKIRGSAANDAVWYVDISQMPKEELTEKIAEFAQAKGVIIDLRGYPNNNDILNHMTDTAITSARWNKPQMIYPDQERIAGYDTSGRWTIQPKLPRIKGKIIFLTGGGAISYAESVMGIVEHYKLGEIVGATTAAANGNVNSLSLPGKASIYWTGMKVLKHDGSQHHLVGIKPTVPASRTIQGIRDGRDEVLEKALSLIP
jgi:C-terminal processing protease CtpA/Prc